MNNIEVTRQKGILMTTQMRLIQSIIVALVFLLSSFTHADMMISPTRVFLDEDNRSATMTLRNNSNGPRTYRLKWEDKRAIVRGGYTNIEEGEEWPSAKELVRFSPRQITVGAGENQTVRFSFRPPADLPNGEYRSHLLLQVIPDISEPTSTINRAGPNDSVGVQIFMQMSFSIPVVAKYNVMGAEVSLQEAKIVSVEKGERLGLEVVFGRTGDASSFGNVLVELQQNSESPVEEIGRYKELSIYPELDWRKIVIPLSKKEIPKGAVVRVAYEGSKESDGKLWAEKVFQIE